MNNIDTDSISNYGKILKYSATSLVLETIQACASHFPLSFRIYTWLAVMGY